MVKTGKYLRRMTPTEWQEKMFRFKFFKQFIKQHADNRENNELLKKHLIDEVVRVSLTLLCWKTHLDGFMQSQPPYVDDEDIKNMGIIATTYALLPESPSSDMLLGEQGKPEKTIPISVPFEPYIENGPPVMAAVTLASMSREQLDDIGDKIADFGTFIYLNRLAFRKIVKKIDKNFRGFASNVIVPLLQRQGVLLITLGIIPYMSVLSSGYKALRKREDPLPPPPHNDLVNAVNDTGNAVQTDTGSITKYCLPLEKVPHFIMEVIKYLPLYLDKNSAWVSSVYLDSPNMELYHQRIRRDVGAKDICIRWYGDSVPSIVFLEQKVYVENQGCESSIKKMELNYDEVIGWLAGAQVAKQLMSENPLGKEIVDTTELMDLQPVVKASCQRFAFQNGNIRISLDTDLTFTQVDLPPWSTHMRHPKQLIFPFAIVELQVPATPKWLENLLRQPWMQPVPDFSKFLQGVYSQYPEKCRQKPYWDDHVQAVIVQAQQTNGKLSRLHQLKSEMSPLLSPSQSVISTDSQAETKSRFFTSRCDSRGETSEMHEESPCKRELEPKPANFSRLCLKNFLLWILPGKCIRGIEAHTLLQPVDIMPVKQQELSESLCSISPEQEKPPLDTCSLFSRLTWSFAGRILDVGMKRNLQTEHLDYLCKSDSAEGLRAVLRQKWQDELTLSRVPSSKPYSPSLLRALVRAFGYRYILIGLLQLLYSGAKIAQALFLQQVVQFIADVQNEDTAPPVWQGYLWAVLLGLSALTQAVIHHQLFFWTWRMGVRARVALAGLIYDKSLALSTASFLSTTTGQVVNLISNDVYKMEELLPFAHQIWVAPLETLVVLILLLQLVGVAAVVGLGCMMLLIPLQTFFARQFGRIRKNTLKYTDRRVKTVNEILTGCEVMKLYNWEEPLERVVHSAREKEFRSITRAAIFKAINQSIMSFTSNLVTFVTLVVYMSIDSTHTLSPATLFVTVVLLNICRLSMTKYFPFVIEKASELAVSLRRISRFLLLDGIPVNAASLPTLSSPPAATTPPADSSGDNSLDAAAVKVTKLDTLAYIHGELELQQSLLLSPLGSPSSSAPVHPPLVIAVDSASLPAVPRGTVEMDDGTFTWESSSSASLAEKVTQDISSNLTSLTTTIERAPATAKRIKRVNDSTKSKQQECESNKAKHTLALPPQTSHHCKDAAAIATTAKKNNLDAIEDEGGDSDGEEEEEYSYYYEEDGNDEEENNEEQAACDIEEAEAKENTAASPPQRIRRGSVFGDVLQKFQMRREAASRRAAGGKAKITVSATAAGQGDEQQHKSAAAAQAGFLEPIGGSPCTLRHLTFRVQPGELCAVVGAIGSCKSSLLAALLGEMQRVSGQARMNGSIGLATQKPWIFAATVRENIIFGRPFDLARYLRVLEACQLVEDIEKLHSGEQTLIGERGVNLSGGQKARVSLARAVYSDADIYLFDEPLSAVDVLVGKKIFDQVLGPKGMLAGRTRILVTHQTNLLPECDKVLLLDHGEIRAFGSYQTLQQFEPDLAAAEVATTLTDASLPAVATASPAAIAVPVSSPAPIPATLAVPSLETKHSDEASSPQQVSAVFSSVPVDDMAEAEAANGNMAAATSTPSKAAQLTRSQDVQNTKNIIQDEERGVGKISWIVYRQFIEGAGGFAVFVAVILIMARWSHQPADQQHDPLYIEVYTGLLCATTVLAVVCAITWFRTILHAAHALHDAMFKGVLYSSLRFFEANPVGRMLNRFSKDQATVDELLPMTAYDFTQGVFLSLASIVVIAVVNPFMLLVILAVAPIFVHVCHRYTVCSREIKRLDAVSRSPIFAHFSSTLSGLMVIRAYGAEEQFSRQFSDRMDGNSRNFFAFLTTSRWLGFRVDFLSSCIVLSTGVLAIATRNSVNPSILGFALTYSLQLTALLQRVIQQSTQLENQMTSVERVVEYGQLPPEGARIIPHNRPPLGWPSKGAVTIKNLKLRYRENLDWVLRGVNASIAPQEKIGVVGRTGAGKSSLFGAFFRLVEPTSGQILIDDIDICKIGLSDLRAQLSIIPQNPVIFSGTLRYNLDPFGRCSIEELWQALEAVQLKQMVVDLPEQLDTRMAEFGANFSLGEAQLVCVARALLKPSKILLVDEATASVDQDTDQLIQAVIRQRFRSRTVITIAHRLNTIIDSDKVMVMSAGEVVEFDTPQSLLKAEGVFASMAKNANLH